MPKRDTLDPELARRLAWRTSLDDAADIDAADADDEEADEDEEEEELDPEANRQRWERAKRGAAELADGIRRAAATRGKAAQVAATAALLQRVKRSMKEGAIDEAGIVARLRRPESLAFRIAASEIGKQPTLAMLDALRAAVDSPARGGAVAAKAASTLVRLGGTSSRC